MKQEDKELLLKDLCARLPYGVKISKVIGDLVSEPRPIRSINLNNIIVEDGEFEDGTPDIDVWNYEEIKPYLFPLSSMTEEQRKELRKIMDFVEATFMNACCKGGFTLSFTNLTDWLNANHFDYRGLIPKDLAIDATGLGVYENNA